jgi:K+-sensing histidine kinase KdpD
MIEKTRCVEDMIAMSDEKAIARLRYDFSVAILTELRTLVSSVVEHSQAALQNGHGLALKKPLATLHMTGQELLSRIVDCLSLEPDRWTSEFLAELLFELKLPWIKIVLYSRHLLEGSFGPVNEAQGSALIQVKKNGEAISRMMIRANDVQRIENRRADARAFLFAEADLKAIVEEFVSLAGERGPAEVEAHGLDVLSKAWIASSQILKALDYIATALSGNFSQGKIVLTAGCDNDMITITLENVGYALLTSTLEEVKRVSSAATLFACRRFDEAFDLCIGQAIVEIHGGKLWMGSRPGGGSQATFTLPVMKH